MARYKITFGWVQYVFGPSESYISKAGVGVNTATKLVQRLITARNLLIFENVNWQGVRIADAEAKRKSKFYPPGTYAPFNKNEVLVVPSKGNYLAPAADNAPDQARASMQYRITYDTDRAVMRYLSGIPDDIIRYEPLPLDFTANPLWKKNWDTFVKVLDDDGWSVRARNRGEGFAITPIIAWTEEAQQPNNMGAVVPSLPDLGLKRGDKVSISGTRRKGTDKLSYNGSYFISKITLDTVNNERTYYLDGTAVGEPSSIKKFGTIQKFGYTFYPIENAEPIRGGVHKRGKPSAGPRGRRTTRALLDP